MNLYLVLALALALLGTAYVISVLRRVQTQLMIIKNALEDIKNGNLNRRILAKENDMTSRSALISTKSRSAARHA